MTDQLAELDWMEVVLQLLNRLDRIHDQLQRIADTLEEHTAHVGMSATDPP